jgi:hypothetical protein
MTTLGSAMPPCTSGKSVLKARPQGLPIYRSSHSVCSVSRRNRLSVFKVNDSPDCHRRSDQSRGSLPERYAWMISILYLVFVETRAGCRVPHISILRCGFIRAKLEPFPSSAR